MPRDVKDWIEYFMELAVKKDAERGIDSSRRRNPYTREPIPSERPEPPPPPAYADAPPSEAELSDLFADPPSFFSEPPTQSNAAARYAAEQIAPQEQQRYREARDARNEDARQSWEAWQAEQIRQSEQTRKSRREAPESLGNARARVEGERQATEPFATFRKMRALAPNPAWINGFNFGYSSNSPSMFVKQAEFMLDFTDDYDGFAEFHNAFPTFQQMNNEQLRTYFTWRTQVRGGNVTATSASYTLLYCSELINNIGIGFDFPEEGMARLINFWRAYRVHDATIDERMQRWTLNYYILNAPIEPFSHYNAQFPVPLESTCDVVDEILFGESLPSLALIERSSSYSITKGQLYRKSDTSLLDRLIAAALGAVDALFTKNELDLRSLLVEQRNEPYTSVYVDAVYSPVRIKTARVVEIDRHTRFVVDGFMHRREYYSFDTYRHAVGFILKTIDARLRVALNFGRLLKLPDSSQMKNNFLLSEDETALTRLKPWKKKAYGLLKRKAFIDAIDAAIAGVLRADAEAEARRVDIDFTQLARIRAEHEETADKLEALPFPSLDGDAQFTDTVPPELDLDTPQVDEPPQAPLISQSDEPKTDGDGSLAMSEAECELIAKLLLGETPQGFDAELLIESINEKALDAIGDNLIDTSGDAPYIYEEYVGMLGL